MTATRPAAAARGSAGAGAGAGARDEAVDAVAVAALGLLAVAGFASVFGGGGFLRLAVIGLAGGLGVAVLVVRSSLHPALALVAAILAFLLLGGAAVPETAIAGVLPGPGTPAELFRGVVVGWKQILTTPPPVGITDSMGVVPYLCGFVAGLGGMLLARRSEWTLAPVIPAVLVLVASILLGTRDPVSVLAQGAVFAAVAIGWGSIRANRPRRSGDGAIYWPRVVSGLAMLLVVVAVAVPISGVLPSSAGDDRLVLREEVVPPFDPRAEPSPLGGLRAYQVDPPAELFTVVGLPAGEPLRLATMDTFDGVVWVVGGPNAGASSRFERVGEEIMPVPDGDPAAVEVTVLGARKDVWMPTVGWTRQVTFDGAAADEQRETFRYNRTTAAAAVPSRLPEGASYDLDARVPVVVDRAQLPPDTPVDAAVSLPPLPPLTEIVEEKAREFTAGATTPLAQAEALEARMTDEAFGFYSDGGPEAQGAAQSAPGHSLYRLNSFLDGDILVGNAEQYAAAMALMARSLGLPARVVMGFDPALGAEGEDAPPIDDGAPLTITGAHAHAWVEIAFEDVGWVPFDPTPPKDNQVDPVPPQVSPQQLEEPQDLDPPSQLQLLEEQQDLSSRQPSDEVDEQSAGFQIPPVVLLVVKVITIPLLVIGGIFGLIVGAKRLRSNRRRRHGTPVDRLSGAWREVCDRATDRGGRPSRRGTRLEVASGISADAWPDAPDLAARIDAIMFGPDDPDDEVVEAVWLDADRAWRDGLAALDLKARLLTMANPASLRRLRW